MKISRETLHQLIENKLCKAGLKREHATTVAEVLVYADARGIHSHGAVRVEYYAERISKAALTANPHFVLKKPVPVQRFCMPIMPPGKSQPRWVWSMPLKLLKKMVSPSLALAEWGTAVPFLTLCSKPLALV